MPEFVVNAEVFDEHVRPRDLGPAFADFELPPLRAPPPVPQPPPPQRCSGVSAERRPFSVGGGGSGAWGGGEGGAGGGDARGAPGRCVWQRCRRRPRRFRRGWQCLGRRHGRRRGNRQPPRLGRVLGGQQCRACHHALAGDPAAAGAPVAAPRRRVPLSSS